MKPLQDELLLAFQEGEFFPVFQPVVELRTGRPTGFEALARWRHKNLGDISANGFIPLLEENGLLDRLSLFILEKAFASPALRDNTLTLAINMSPLQLLHYQSSDRLQEVAAQHSFDLNRLTVEITESALVNNLERSRSAAGELKALHCKLALDDFGTGYSSLKHLHAFPFDELKIDRSFIHSMTQKPESLKIVAAIVGMGQSLGLTTVAEGVETQEEADMLVSLGCDYAQGWLYSKPCTVAELPTMVSATWPGASIAAQAPLEADTTNRLDPAAEERLAQLQAFYDGAPVGLCFLDREMRYVSLNKRLTEIHGIPAEEHLGRSVAEVIPHVFPLVEKYIRRALEGESMRGVKVTRPPQDGQPGPPTVLFSCQPAHNQAGEVLGVGMAIMDVPERRRP